MSEEKTDLMRGYRTGLQKPPTDLNILKTRKKKPSMIFLFGLIESPIFSQTSCLVTIVF